MNKKVVEYFYSKEVLQEVLFNINGVEAELA